MFAHLPHDVQPVSQQQVIVAVNAAQVFGVDGRQRIGRNIQSASIQELVWANFHPMKDTSVKAKNPMCAPATQRVLHRQNGAVGQPLLHRREGILKLRARHRLARRVRTQRGHLAVGAGHALVGHPQPRAPRLLPRSVRGDGDAGGSASCRRPGARSARQAAGSRRQVARAGRDLPHVVGRAGSWAQARRAGSGKSAKQRRERPAGPQGIKAPLPTRVPVACRRYCATSTGVMDGGSAGPAAWALRVLGTAWPIAAARLGRGALLAAVGQRPAAAAAAAILHAAAAQKGLQCVPTPSRSEPAISPRGTRECVRRRAGGGGASWTGRGRRSLFAHFPCFFTGAYAGSPAAQALLTPRPPRGGRAQGAREAAGALGGSGRPSGGRAPSFKGGAQRPPGSPCRGAPGGPLSRGGRGGRSAEECPTSPTPTPRRPSTSRSAGPFIISAACGPTHAAPPDGGAGTDVPLYCCSPGH